MLDPTPDRIRALRQTTSSDVVLLTLAPERRGAIEAVALLTSLGMKVSLGHTNAPASCLREAVAAGATGFTHLGNTCPQELDRHDNILWRVPTRRV
jgi:N-acetylglucosamine-6-phosphate deacetylase